MTKTNNEFDKNNVELMTGLKSRIGVAAGGAQNATSSINVTNN